MDGIRIKDEVRFDPRTISRTEFWKMTEAAQATSPTNYFITITSGCDGKHLSDSRHYLGWAKDYRIRDVPGVDLEETLDGWICKKGLVTLTQWVKRMEKRLGDQYFVELDLPKMHIHAQYNGGR